MATFSNSGSGGVRSCGCALITYCKTHTTLYGPRDVVYNIHKARRGTLEKVVIKKLKVIDANKIGGLFQVMYVDTLNGLWNESDLVSHSQAVNLATSYCQDMLDLASAIKC